MVNPLIVVMKTDFSNLVYFIHVHRFLLIWHLASGCCKSWTQSCDLSSSVKQAKPKALYGLVVSYMTHPTQMSAAVRVHV